MWGADSVFLKEASLPAYRGYLKYVLKTGQVSEGRVTMLCYLAEKSLRPYGITLPH